MTTIYTGTLPSKVDLACYRGDTWSQQFRFLAGGDPIDLTGYQLASWCRSNAGEVYLMAVVAESDPGLVTLSITDWDEVMRMIVTSALVLARHCIPGMIAQGWAGS
jgi:NAD(P)-dependent dehydrogenase (short-subunit alcohol dehydrogenase family)